jgi:opacity protein-like surface antigen
MFVVSLNCEIAAAAESGFYVGAAGGRSEQRLDKQAGVGPVAVLVAAPQAGFVPNPVTPAPGLPIFIPTDAAFLTPETTVDDTSVGWNVSLGYRVNKYLAAELAYVNSGEASLMQRYASFTVVPVPFPDIYRGYTVTSRGPALSVLGSLPLSSQWEVFLRGGVLFAKQEVETQTNIIDATVPSVLYLDREFSDEVYTVGAGVQWAFLPRWTARLEYQRTDDLQANEIMGESRIDQASLSVLFGL